MTKTNIATLINHDNWQYNGRHPEPKPETVLALWDVDERKQDDKRKFNSGKFMVQIVDLFARRSNGMRFNPETTYMTINSALGAKVKTPKAGKESVKWEVSASIFDMATDKRLYRIVYKNNVDGKSAVYGATDEEFLAGPDWRTDIADWMKCTSEKAAAKEAAHAAKAVAKEKARLAKLVEKANAKEADKQPKVEKAKAAAKTKKPAKKAEPKVEMAVPAPAPAVKAPEQESIELDINLDEFESEEFNG